MTKVVGLPNETDYSYCEFVAPNSLYCPSVLRPPMGPLKCGFILAHGLDVYKKLNSIKHAQVRPKFTGHLIKVVGLGFFFTFC